MRRKSSIYGVRAQLSFLFVRVIDTFLTILVQFDY